MSTPDVTAATSAREVDELLTYATAGGATIHAALSVRAGQERGRGIFATEAIANNTLLLRVPLSLAVLPAKGSLADLVASGGCSRLLALALTVLHELHVKEPRAPYFDLLAASPLPSTPSLWSEEAVVAIEGTSLMPKGATASDAAAATRTAFETDVLPMMDAAGDGYMPARVRSQRLFAEALAWVMSRALLGRISYEQGEARLWPYLRADGPPTAANILMLPLFDLLNTSSHAAHRCAVLTQVGGDLPAIEVRATRDVAAGEEVLIPYGQHHAAELLRTYGIAEPLSSCTPLVVLELEVAEVIEAARSSMARAGSALTAARAQARREMLARAGKLPVCFTLTSEALLPAPLLTCVHMLVMDDDDADEWVEAGGPWLGPAFLDEESLPLVAGALLSLADTRLKGLAPPREANEADGDAVAMARSLVARERRLLDTEFKRAVLELACAEEGEEEEDDEEDNEEEEGEEDDDEEDEQDDEDDEPSKKRAKK